jgi:sec-independent protein translocase protein TatC
MPNILDRIQTNHLEVYLFNMQTPTLTYLIEIRKRLLKTSGFTLLLFIPLFFNANALFEFLAKPLLRHLNGPMIAIQVTAPLLVPIELAAKIACLLTMPYLLYQIWSFVNPALYKNEGNLIKGLYGASLLLFVLGLLFCYFIVLPLLFGFFTQATTPNVQLMPDISFYLSLTTRFFLLFGCAFQIPVIIFFLIKSQLIQHQQLITSRPYVIVSAFIIGMLLTPPDVLSQLLLAVPMCILFELGVFASKKLIPKCE